MRRLSALLVAAAIGFAVASCGDSGGSGGSGGSGDSGAPNRSDPALGDESSSTDPMQAWTEEAVTFSVGRYELSGVLTLPASSGPHAAVVIASGSESQDGTIQSGVSETYFVDLAHQFADEGYATLRYDTKGVGQSDGEAGFQTLEAKRDEVLAALRHIQEHLEIRADDVGLWAISQEAWIIGMAAAEQPDDVAFIVSVSGSGVSVAEQQVWGIETQSSAAGLASIDVDRATLFGGLLVDWQLTEPRFETSNQHLVDNLGDGPWQDFFTLVYDSDTVGPVEELRQGVEILTAVQDEPWAAALHLEELYLPQLRSIPADQIELVTAAAEQTLLTDPAEYLRRVTSPVLAFFGEDDIVQPTDRSAELYALYLGEAGNDDLTIVVLPSVGHDISLTTPGYWDELVQWLDER